MLPAEILERITKESFLVTGGAGFIGSNIVARLLDLGAERVTVLDDLSTGDKANFAAVADHSRFTFIHGDIRDPRTCELATGGISIILHQAALGSVPRSIADPAATNSVNVDGFVNMLNAAKAGNVKRFVYASSSSVYGDDQTMPKVEEKTGNLLSPYAVTKHTNEKYAHVFSKVYGLETIGLRYFNVFGPHQNPNGPYAAVIPLFIQAMMKNESPVIFGDGENTRDFTFIDNVVNANILAALTKNAAQDSPVINIAYGGTVSLNNMFRMLAAISGFAEEPQYAGERKGDIRNSYADITKARQILGYTPGVDLQEGLEKTYRWYKNNNS